MAIPGQLHSQSFSHQDVDIAMYVLSDRIPGRNPESFEYYTSGGYCASNGHLFAYVLSIFLGTLIPEELLG